MPARKTPREGCLRPCSPSGRPPHAIREARGSGSRRSRSICAVNASYLAPDLVVVGQKPMPSVLESLGGLSSGCAGSSSRELNGKQAIAANVEANSVEESYLAGKTVDWRKSRRFRNLLVCPGVLTMGQIDEEVVRSSVKFGCPPKVIVIDYAQLTQTPGNRSRYGRMSDVCENAKCTDTGQ